jgi:hypothetical protein
MSALVLPFSGVAGLFAAASIGLVYVDRADIVQLSFFPVTAILGIWTFLSSPHQSFVSLVFALWLYAPMVRRVVDWQLGRTDASLIILAPYVVTALAWFSAIRVLRTLSAGQSSAFLAYTTVVIFGCLNGMLRGYGAAAIFDLLAYLAPLGFGLHLLAARENLSALGQHVLKLLIFHAVIISAYGLVQFVFVLPWDAEWMREAAIQSIGQPLPFLVRIYATLNAPGILAVFLMVALLISTLAKPHRFILSALPIALCLWLSLVRSAWGGAALGFAILLTFSPIRIKFDMLVGGLFCAGLVFLGVSVLEVPTGLFDRISTVFGLNSDDSLLARIGIVGDIVPAVLGNPLGYGLGSTGISTIVGLQDPNTYRIFDSGLLDVTYTMGWAGLVIWTLLGMWLCAALRNGMSTPRLLPIAAALCALASQMLFFNILSGVAGVLFFTLLSIALQPKITGSRSV